MAGNLAGTFSFELAELLALEATQSEFEEKLQLSSRIYKARKADDVAAFELLATEVVELAKASEFSKEHLAKLAGWPKRFHAVTVNRIVSEMIDG
jgi:hypothetical protein